MTFKKKNRKNYTQKKHFINGFGIGDACVPLFSNGFNLKKNLQNKKNPFDR